MIIKNLEGFASLNVAAEAGKYEIFEYLLSMGAARNKKGWAPLHSSASSGEQSLVDILRRPISNYYGRYDPSAYRGHVWSSRVRQQKSIDSNANIGIKK